MPKVNKEIVLQSNLSLLKKSNIQHKLAALNGHLAKRLKLPSQFLDDDFANVQRRGCRW